MKKTKYELYISGVISESQYEAAKNAANHVPNLDAMTSDQLKSFALMYRNPRPEEAVHMTGMAEPESAMEAAKLLAVYATNKKIAMENRAAGNIGVAIQHEDECDKIYDRLPENIKW